MSRHAFRGSIEQIVAGQRCGDIRAEDLRQWKVELMGCCVHGVVLNGSQNIESGLLKTKRQASGTREQVDC